MNSFNLACEALKRSVTQLGHDNLQTQFRAEYISDFTNQKGSLIRLRGRRGKVTVVNHPTVWYIRSLYFSQVVSMFSFFITETLLSAISFSFYYRFFPRYAVFLITTSLWCRACCFHGDEITGKTGVQILWKKAGFFCNFCDLQTQYSLGIAQVWIDVFIDVHVVNRNKNTNK